VYAWGLGVILPHLFAVTKTPSATLIGAPAFFLLVGHLVAEAWRGQRWPLAALAAVLALSLLFPAVIRNPGHGYPPGRGFGGVVRQAPWVIGHVAGALVMAAGLVGAAALVPRHLSRHLHRGALLFCLCALAWLGGRTVWAAWTVTCRNAGDPSSAWVGRFAREHLPDNAVLLCEENRPGEHLALMFYADRTCYALAGRRLDRVAEQVHRAGGIPYVVSRRRLPLPPVHASGQWGPTVYRWTKEVTHGADE
jgi:hypothetical protein